MIVTEGFWFLVVEGLSPEHSYKDWMDRGKLLLSYVKNREKLIQDQSGKDGSVRLQLDDCHGTPSPCVCRQVFWKTLFVGLQSLIFRVTILICFLKINNI